MRLICCSKFRKNVLINVQSIRDIELHRGRIETSTIDKWANDFNYIRLNISVLPGTLWFGYTFFEVAGIIMSWFGFIAMCSLFVINWMIRLCLFEYFDHISHLECGGVNLFMFADHDNSPWAASNQGTISSKYKYNNC